MKELPTETLLNHLSLEELAAFCKQFQIRELSIFGSAVRQDFGPDSDLDLLVSFEPNSRVTFLTLARMQRELESHLGRKVDLVPKAGLKSAIRRRVLAEAQVLYAA